MKLATYQDGSRDGHLVVVSRDLSMAHYATGIATRLQQVLDDWNFLSPQLQDLYDQLNQGRARHAFSFDPARAMAPLPRASRHVVAERTEAGPVLHERAPDGLLGPADPVVEPHGIEGLDVAVRLVAVTGDVPAAVDAPVALEGVRLLGWACELSILEEGGAASPWTSVWAPVWSTPDEYGAAWSDGRLRAQVQIQAQGRKLGLCDASGHALGELIERLVRPRGAHAGTLVASAPMRPAESSLGHGCLADKRAAEAAQHGQPRTRWLNRGDAVRIEAKVPEAAESTSAIQFEIR
ncbi:MAG: fumarylacetoacetate hydrolase [Pseudomonadota bacterium]